MAWRAYYDTNTGSLLSVGSVDPPSVPSGVSVIDLLGPPNLDLEMWDELLRQFVTRPPKVLVDRLEDMLTSPDYADWQTVYNALNATRKTTVRNVLIRLLGSHRWRSQGERTELNVGGQ